MNAAEPMIIKEKAFFQNRKNTSKPRNFTNEDDKNKTIKAVNISVEITYSYIIAVFSNFKKIQNKDIKILMGHTYKTAFVKYKDEQNIQQFYQVVWSAYIRKDQVGLY